MTDTNLSTHYGIRNTPLIDVARLMFRLNPSDY